MSAAIAALLAAISVVFALSLTTTQSTPIDTFTNVLVGLINGRGRMLTESEATTALLYAIVVYMLVFSVVYFFLRALALFGVAFGWPDEAQLRRNRELRRQRGSQIEMMRRQARLNAVYTVRAQQAALATQRKRQARTAPPLPPATDPTLADFDLK